MNSRRPVNSTVMLLNLTRREILHATALISIALSSCLQVNKFNHQPTMAGGKAQQFADTAFIEHDFPAAYDLLSQNMKTQFSLEQLKDLVSKMHPAQYPASVEATEYEPLPGQKAMNIFLSGVAGKERFYYRFVMEGRKKQTMRSMAYGVATVLTRHQICESR